MVTFFSKAKQKLKWAKQKEQIHFYIHIKKAICFSRAVQSYLTHPHSYATAVKTVKTLENFKPSITN